LSESSAPTPPPVDIVDQVPEFSFFNDFVYSDLNEEAGQHIEPSESEPDVPPNAFGFGQNSVPPIGMS
jgi:hypothetical protein